MEIKDIQMSFILGNKLFYLLTIFYPDFILLPISCILDIRNSCGVKSAIFLSPE